MNARWAPEVDLERLTPSRAAACQRVATALGYPHRCAHCDAELGAGAVAGFRTTDALRCHMLSVHGEAT